MSLSNKKVNCLIVRNWIGSAVLGLYLTSSVIIDYFLAKSSTAQSVNWAGFCTARPRWFRQEENQALMSAISKNFVISFFVRSVVPVIAETMLKTAGLIHQNGYEEIFKFTECRHGTWYW